MNQRNYRPPDVEINPRALVSVKVSTPTDVDMVAVGSYYAGAHVVQLDGSYGGTGAAPPLTRPSVATSVPVTCTSPNLPVQPLST